MDHALVLGATGGMGYSIVKELVSRGIKVTAFARNEGNLQKMFQDQPYVNIKIGDALKQGEMEVAATNVDVIFHAINLPYGDWEKKLHVLTKNIAETASGASAKLVIVDNIYAYGRGNGLKVKETFPKNPHTKKGKIRLEMEQIYKGSGVPYLIAHFPDFYGPFAENTLLNYTLRQVAANKRASYVGNPHIKREFIYTPDGAKAIAQLAMKDDAYNQNWNIPGYGVISGEEICEIARELTGSRRPFKIVTKNMLGLVALFNVQMRETLEMQYLNENPVVLDGEKYEKFIGDVPKTTYYDGIRETLTSYGK